MTGSAYPLKHILIIDDEEGFCNFIKETLEMTGKYQVIIATDGVSGLKAARHHKPDLILLDIIMPVMDGFQVLKTLKEDPRTLAIPVIVLTVVSDAEAKKKAASLYDEEYIVKPVRIAELKTTLETVLSLHPAHKPG